MGWESERQRKMKWAKRIIKIKGPQSVMYPSSHDITPKFLEIHIRQIQYLLNREFSLLIVSKPHLDCIREICKEFSGYRDKILFRFTIGSSDDKILKFWEPGAPSFEERLSCLKYASDEVFNTSVSCEPMLDNNIHEVISSVKSYVSDSIWLGKANRLRSCLSINGYKKKALRKKSC